MQTNRPNGLPRNDQLQPWIKGGGHTQFLKGALKSELENYHLRAINLPKLKKITLFLAFWACWPNADGVATGMCAPKIHIETMILYASDWFIYWSYVYVFECSLNTSLFEFDACCVGSFCAYNVCSCCVLCRARKARKKPLQVRNLRDFDQFI